MARAELHIVETARTAPDAEDLFAASLRTRRHEVRVTDEGKVTRLPAPLRPAPAPAPDAATASPRDPRPLGQILIELGAVDPGHLLQAVVMRRREQARLGEILLARGWVREPDLMRALCLQWRTSQLDPAAAPDARLIDAVGAETCLAHGILPWRRVGAVTFIATARPEEFAALREGLPAGFGSLRMLLATESQVRGAILTARGHAILHQAETSVSAVESARQRRNARVWAVAALLVATLAAGMALAPSAALAGLTLLTALILLGTMGLRLTAFLAHLRLRRRRAAHPPAPDPLPERLPVISVMVPMFREADIAARLVARLERLTYPRALTDILLVVEESDAVTRAALARAQLPRWMRVITVPDGPVRTKPRALNYALNFCRGGIVGVWDAEDQPEPDQLLKVARRFAAAPPDVACLQGVLDFYNPRTNWLARCFTIEYAMHFRAILPGIAALGLVVPLGGTTIFFRRKLLEDVGAWDAWNVTEDADLGMRLARRGLRTEMLDSTTFEEANCRAVPWIRQRSRWLKGFFMTWAVHMRQPRLLRRQIGTAPFLAFQIQMLGCVAGYLLAPLLWACWMMTLGAAHPVAALLGGRGAGALVALFLSAEAVNIAIGVFANRAPARRHLLRWLPTCFAYYPLGCFAGWKAIWEVLHKPFYWDKTVHGVFDATETPPAPATPPAQTVALRRLIAAQAGPRSPEAEALRTTALRRAGRALDEAPPETHQVEVIGRIS